MNEHLLHLTTTPTLTLRVKRVAERTAIVTEHNSNGTLNANPSIADSLGAQFGRSRFASQAQQRRRTGVGAADKSTNTRQRARHTPFDGGRLGRTYAPRRPPTRTALSNFMYAHTLHTHLHWSQGGPHSRRAQYVRVAYDTPPEHLMTLFDSIWKIQQPRLVITRRDDLIGQDTVVQYHAQSFSPRGKLAVLNDKHSHFLLVDNGTVAGARAVRLIFQLPGTIRAVLNYVTNSPPVPVVVCDGSGRAADIIAFAHKFAQHATEQGCGRSMALTAVVCTENFPIFRMVCDHNWNGLSRTSSDILRTRHVN
ncbi:unnamed protein product [Sphagnum balticum]